MATPPTTAGSLATVTGMLNDVVVLKEQQVIAAVGALVAARLEVKTWVELQAAMYSYAPIGPYLGPDEERLVWRPVLGAIRDLAAAGGLGASASLQQGMREMAREVRARFSANMAACERAETAADTTTCSAAGSHGGAGYDGDCTASPAAGASASTPGDRDEAATDPSTSDPHAEVAAGQMSLDPETSPPTRRGLRGVRALEAADAVGSSPGEGRFNDADEAGTGDPVGTGAASATGAGSGASVGVDLRSVLLRAARTFGEAVVVLDALSVARLKRVTEEFSGPGYADVVMPIVASVALIIEVSDALDSCSVELLKKCEAIPSGTPHARSAPAVPRAPCE